MRVLISMPENFLKQVDEFSDYSGRTRSELIRTALQSYIKANDEFAQIKRVKERAMRQ